ncbi:hypothetical protein Droror1_Dr00003700 [Drosera rotundifolia]
MVDLKEHVNEEQSSSPSTGSQQRCDQSNWKLKSCVDCLTTNTPLWRGGPAGPKSLCNACGIKYHKKRRALLGLQKGRQEKPPNKKSKNANNRYNNGTKDNSDSSGSDSSGSYCNNDDNKKSSSGSYCNNNGTEHEEVGKGSSSLKMSTSSKVFALGEGMLLKKLNGSSWMRKKKLLLRGDLREEEQAAILLMALSCGSLYC